MAFNDESLTMLTSFPSIEEDHDRYHQTRNSLSRLSICTSSVYDESATKKNIKTKSTVFVSESFDGAEADVEDSDNEGGKENVPVPEWNSDNDTSRFYSLPVTPSRRRDGKKCNLRRERRVNKEKKNIKAKGGEKSFRKGLDEVKACRELGFDVEVPVPGRISVSTGSNFDTQTSSGGNSPIATWRISSPGDNPKEVKARLKVWAQAVALASTSRQV